VEFPSKPAATLPPALGRLRVALDDAYVKASRELGLTGQQAELICAAISPAAIGDLAEQLRCDRSNVSRLVERASAQGLLKRRVGDKDGRVTVVELTPKGERLAGRFLAALEALTRDLRAGWPRDRERLAVEIVNEISDALDKGGPTLRSTVSEAPVPRHPKAVVRGHGPTQSGSSRTSL